jgi:hypothetical protein
MAAECKGMELSAYHLQGAKILLEDIEVNMRAVFDRIAMTESGSLTEEIYNAIRTAPGKDLPRSAVLRRFGHKIGAQDLQKVIETLVMQGRVKLDTSGDGKLHYRTEE